MFTSFEHIAAFVISKELLEPIRPIAESLQGWLQEVEFGFYKMRSLAGKLTTTEFMKKQRN